MLQPLLLMTALGVGQCDPGISYGYGYPVYSTPIYSAPVYYSQPTYYPVQSSPQYHITRDVSGNTVYTTHDISETAKTFYAWCRYPIGIRRVPIVADYVPEYTEYTINGQIVPYYDFTKRIRYSTLNTAVDGRRPIATESVSPINPGGEQVINNGRLPENKTTSPIQPTPSDSIEKLLQRFDKMERDMAETRSALQRVIDSQPKTVPFIEPPKTDNPPGTTVAPVPEGPKPPEQPKTPTVPEGMKRPGDLDRPK